MDSTSIQQRIKYLVEHGQLHDTTITVPRRWVVWTCIAFIALLGMSIAELALLLAR